jgi:hypothetical protein
MKALGLALVLLPLALRAEEARPVPRPGLTWAAADALAQRFAEMEARVRRHQTPSEGTVMVRDGELNSWVNLTLGPRLPPGLSDLALRFEKDRVSATGNVDLSRIPIKQAAGASALNPLSYLGGTVPVELIARLTTEDGFGSVVPEQVRIASIPLATSVVAQIVAQATRTSENPEGFDILSPFRLPYAAKRIRLAPGKAFLEF